MYLSFLIIFNKIITGVLKIFGKNASVYAGSIIYQYFDQKILTKIKYPPYVIAVTGSSGKGSTTDLIAKILTAEGLKVIYNQSGSNGVLGAATLILNNCNYKGHFKGDVLLLEADERHLRLIFSKNKPTHLVLTNITRDQPVRNGHPKSVFEAIASSLDDQTHVIINADDPLINTIKLLHHGQISTYGIVKTNASFKKPRLDNLDFAYCPVCQTKLVYDYYHYGHLGSYYCPNDDYKRGLVDYEATDINLKAKQIKINNNLVTINSDVLYAAYASLAAYALTSELKVAPARIIKTLNDHQNKAKRGQLERLANRDFIMLESKNENNLSYYQSIKYIADYQQPKSIIMGFENVSRRYKENDLSWLYDVEFELLNDDKIDKIFCIGRFRYDVATRLTYAKIDPTKIILVDDTKHLINQVKNESQGTIFSIVCFDMTAIIKGLLEEEKNGNN